MKPKLIIVMISGVLLILGIAGAWFIWTLSQAIFGAGRTQEETAQILVHDLKFGGRATQRAISYGDAILPRIQKASNNFSKLNSRNAFWIAEVLGAIKTERSRAMLEDLYSRTDHLAKLVGACGLAQQGALKEELDEHSFLVHTVRRDAQQAETQLAIIALGKSRNLNALPYLLEVLEKNPPDYGHNAYACEAVARIGDPKAIPVLRKCLASEEFYALPEAFRALITLGDREAVPLAIRRISPELKGYSGGDIVNELKLVTGKSYGYNKEAWEKWWQSVESSWQIPPKFQKFWDEQKKRGTWGL